MEDMKRTWTKGPEACSTYSLMARLYFPNTRKAVTQIMKKFWLNLEKSESYEPEVLNPIEALCEGAGPFRKNAAALVLKNQGREILLGERADTPDHWQWPQGGLDPGESAEAGLRRELKEEIGVSKIRIIHRFPFKLRYRFPRRMATKFRPNLGQEQVYFMVEIDEAPDLDKSDGEFSRLRWSPLELAVEHAIWFKEPVYRAALSYAAEAVADLYPLPD